MREDITSLFESETEAVKPTLDDIAKRTTGLMDTMLGKPTTQVAVATPKQVATPQSSGGNPMGGMVAVLTGVAMLQFVPTLLNTMTQAFGGLGTAFGGQSHSSPQSQAVIPVQCSLCGWRGYGTVGMVCPQCGRV